MCVSKGLGFMQGVAFFSRDLLSFVTTSFFLRRLDSGKKKQVQEASIVQSPIDVLS
jgi:hypothetical protein